MSSTRQLQQVSLLYAALLARKHGLELCDCSKSRCKVCLNCIETHCLCGRTTSSQAIPASIPAAQVQDLIGHYIQPRLKTLAASSVAMGVSRSCQICGGACGPDLRMILRCEGCSRCYHATCLSIETGFLPEGLWFCKACFPEAAHIYYPSQKQPQISVLEKARVLQIISGDATNLPAAAQLAFVEHYIQQVPTPSGIKLFVHKK